MIFSGEICRYCGRPITLDDKNPQLARCRKCGAPFHTQCWFAANEKCVVPGCDGKASDISAPRIQDTVGEICPFLPPDSPRREGSEPSPAKCLKTKCMLYDAVEKRCGLGEVAYALATVREAGRQTRQLIAQVVGSSAKQNAQLLTNLQSVARNTEKEIRDLHQPQEKVVGALGELGGLLGDIKNALGALSSDQQGIVEGFDRLAGAVEATGVGERVRSRREARLAARSALRDGRPGAAVNLLQQAEKRAGDDSVLNDLANAWIQAGKPDEAGKVLERVLQSNPGFTPSRITQAALRLRTGDAGGAEKLLRDAPEPANPMLRAELAYARACVAYAVGRSEDAVDLLNRALDEDPWHAQAAAALSDLRARRTGEPVPEAASIALETAGLRRRKAQPVGTREPTKAGEAAEGE